LTWRRSRYPTHNSTAIEGNTLILKEVRQLLDTGQAVGQFARPRTGLDQPPALALAFDGRSHRILQAIQLTQRGFESQTALLLFKLPDAQQTAKGARGSHPLNLRGQRREFIDAVGKADLLARILSHEAPHCASSSQGAVEIRVRARLVGPDPDQIL